MTHRTITVQPLHGPDRHNPHSRPELPERIVSMAEAEYERKYGQRQTADRLRERGGLSAYEVIILLAAALERWAPTEELTPLSRRRKADGR